VRPPAKTIERSSPGDVVSVPLGKRFLDSVKMLVGGDKASPDAEFTSRLPIGYGEEPPAVEGDAKGRAVVSRPEEPQLLIDVPAGAEIEIQFTVDPAGAVTDADVTVSSGRPSLDAQWLKYLKRWEFSPLGLDVPPVEQRGRVRFRLKHGGK
jgi:TonB family protein